MPDYETTCFTKACKSRRAECCPCYTRGMFVRFASLIKRLLSCALAMAAGVTAFGASINIDTGVADWEVFVPGTGDIAAVSVSPNGAWAPAPTGSSWVSFSSVASTSCVVGQTPGNGCANTLTNPSGDIWAYTLTVSAATLGATSGQLSFVFGADNRVSLFAGNEPAQIWNGGSTTNGTGFNPLGCSGTPNPSSAGGTNPYTCNTSITFNASDLNGDGSLTLTAYVYNDPIPDCPACGDPTGFVLDGTLTSGAVGSPVPEPLTFGLVGFAGVAGWAIRRRRRTSTSESADGVASTKRLSILEALRYP